MNANRNIVVGASCSMGRNAYLHDIRESITPNVTPELVSDNVVLVDLLKNIPTKDEHGKTRTTEERIEALINQELDPYLHAYNDKQKRKDRKIKEEHYCDWHRNQGNKSEKMVYEFVMQYGTREDLGKEYYSAATPEEKAKIRQEYIDTYKKWLADWQKQFPQMKVLWSVIHFDEKQGTPHSHTAILPIDHFDQKIEYQVSLSKCLENAGYKRLKTRKEGYQLTRAFRDFREIQERDLKEMGYEIKAPGPNRPHLQRDQYILEQEFKALQEQNQELEAKIEAHNEEIIDLKDQLADYETKKRNEEAELGILKAKTKSELYKERRLLNKEVKDLPNKDFFGRLKTHEYAGGSYLQDIPMGEYNGLITRVEHLSDGIKEVQQTDIAGKEQIELLQNLVKNESEYINQQAHQLAREMLEQDRERILENKRKSQELQKKEMDLIDKENELAEIIRETAMNMLDKALSQGVFRPLATFIQELFPQIWQQYEAHLEREKMFAKQHIQQQSVKIDRSNDEITR